jgi:hypothetical protein
MRTVLFFICLYAGICIPLIAPAQKNAGIFYSTLFAKTAPYKRLAGFGVGASQFFMKDVNADGKDDAIAYFGNGDWYVAISDGTNFGTPKKFLSHTVTAGIVPMMGDMNGDHKQDAVYFNPTDGSWLVALSNDTAFAAPVQWSIGNGVGSVDRFLADVNGDGKDDAVIYFHTGLPGYWYVGLSNGVNGFGGFTPWITGFGTSSNQRMLGDVNGDGKVDAIYYTKSTGTWNVALSSGAGFTATGAWRTGFGTGKEQGFVYDVDRDGKADIVYYDGGEWWTNYSSGTAFGTYNHRWVVSNRPANAKGNVPAPAAKLLASMSGSITEASIVSNGEWLCLGNSDKGATGDAVMTDTWNVWGNDYEPQLPGHVGTYDSGDSTINDIQLKMMHDAGFTYIMFDLTNGVNPWVDNRAKQFIQRIKKWNANLTSGKHKMFFCVSMGGSRAASGTDAAMSVIESESAWAWNDFYLPNQDEYYQLNGKPLLVHFVEWTTNSNAIINYTGGVAHPNYNKFSIRWMYNAIYNDTIYSNAYGWPIYNKYGNPPGNEVMDVMPGFWNGGTGSPREQGDLYRSQWLRVLQYNPASVWLNSFNESWEHTAVEPSYIKATNTLDNAAMDSTWTDYYGDRMDDFYWVMTKQYNRLFMYDQLFDGSYIQEYGHAEVYKVTGCSFVYQGTMPHQAPVLLVPDGFRSNFSGEVIDASFDQVCAPPARKAPSVVDPKDITPKDTKTKPLSYTVFPNPSQTLFTLKVSSNDNGPVNIKVMDVSGKLVEQFNKTNGNSTYQLGQHYIPGNYLLEISNGKNKETCWLIKQ